MYSKDIKQIAIQLYYKLKNLRKVENFLNIGKSTVHRWLHNNSYSQKKQYFNLNPFIKFLIDTNIFIRIKDIKNEIFNKFNISLSITSIRNIIVHSLNYSFKKINKKSYCSSIEKLVSLQNDFKNKIKFIDQNKIISIDETYISNNIFNNYSWSLRGSRCEYFSKVNQKKYSIIVAISINGIEHFKIYDHNITTSSFLSFMQFLNNKFHDHYFLMDNVSFHKSKLITNSLTNNNKIIYIPPYSPQFNPIEEVFSFIKNKIKFTTNNNKIDEANKILNNLNNYSFHNFYRHSFCS